MRHGLAILALTEQGTRLGATLQAQLPESALYVPERFVPLAPVAQPMTGPPAARLAALWPTCTGLICLMATGIVVRGIAPLLQGKAEDPAVVVMDEAGQYAISLLSGHLGGANQLARQVAMLCGAQAVITTATDVNGLLAWDEAARCAGLAIEPLALIKIFNRMLLEQAPVALIDPEQRIAPWFATSPEVLLAETPEAALAQGAHGCVLVSNRLATTPAGMPTLLLRPRNLLVGIGCNRDTPETEIASAVARTLALSGLAQSALAGVATIAAKGDEPGLLAYAANCALPLHCYSATELNAVVCPSPASAAVQAAVGAAGVCEPAALLAARGGRLLVPKQKCGNVTVAVAERPAPPPFMDTIA